MPGLIVNADDFGYTAGVNRAIWELARAGALSSATLMARGTALPEAASEAGRERGGGLGIGCHIVLLDGLACAPPDAVPSLLAPGPGVHGFRPKLPGFVRDLMLGRIREGEIEREAVAQISALQQLGIRVSHVDTHKHTHMFPRVLRPLLRAALVCGVRAIRNPFEPEWSRRATLASGAGVSEVRRWETAVLGRLREQFLRQVREARLRTTDGALGVLATGVLDERVLLSLLHAAEAHEGTWELVCHPGYHDPALDAAATRLRGEREVERQALLAAAGAAPGLRRISFADLG